MIQRGILGHHDIQWGKFSHLELITVRQVLIVIVVVIIAAAVGWGSGGRDSRGGGGRHRGWVACRRGNDDCVCDTEDLTNIDVVAVGVDLGVILVEKSGVHVVSSSDGTASIVLLHGIDGGTIFALVSQTDGLVGNKVRALVVDNALVNGGQLVRGDLLRNRDSVADVSCLYSVLANARASGDDRDDCSYDESTEEHIYVE